MTTEDGAKISFVAEVEAPGVGPNQAAQDALRKAAA
jgi:hypothetical protein